VSCTFAPTRREDVSLYSLYSPWQSRLSKKTAPPTSSAPLTLGCRTPSSARCSTTAKKGLDPSYGKCTETGSLIDPVGQRKAIWEKLNSLYYWWSSAVLRLKTSWCNRQHCRSSAKVYTNEAASAKESMSSSGLHIDKLIAALVRAFPSFIQLDVR
jgi:hypothetical protein